MSEAKIEIIDTHAHIYVENFQSDIKEIIEIARDEGVSTIFLPNIDSKSIDDMLRLEENFPNECKAMMGLHPCSVDTDFKKELSLVSKWFSKREFCGVGETGIDLYWDKTYVEEQKKAFEYQIDLAQDAGIPVIIHSRESLFMTIDVIKQKQKGNLKGVFHCFSGSLEQAKQIIDLGFMMGIGGVVTYKNSGLANVIAQVGLTNMVLETDSPYLPPVPMRGKRNEPSYLKYILEKTAEFANQSIEVTALQTTANARRLFNVTPSA